MGVGKYADTVASNLPYGLQRRLEIARAIASEPKVLLLDEPAAGMNPPESSDPCPANVEHNLRIGLARTVRKHGP